MLKELEKLLPREDRKHKRRKRPTENTPKTIKKTVIGSYISIITLNVNVLNLPTKDTDWLGG